MERPTTLVVRFCVVRVIDGMFCAWVERSRSAVIVLVGTRGVRVVILDEVF